MNAYCKTILIALGAVAASAAIAARSAQPPPPITPDPTIVILPAAEVTKIMQFLFKRPYEDVALLINGLQRCIQDQVPDSSGVTVSRGGCPEINSALLRLGAPPAHAHPAPSAEPPKP